MSKNCSRLMQTQQIQGHTSFSFSIKVSSVNQQKKQQLSSKNMNTHHRLQDSWTVYWHTVLCSRNTGNTVYTRLSIEKKQKTHTAAAVEQKWIRHDLAQEKQASDLLTKHCILLC